jgi:hypothetical protein
VGWLQEAGPVNTRFEGWFESSNLHPRQRGLADDPQMECRAIVFEAYTSRLASVEPVSE